MPGLSASSSFNLSLEGIFLEKHHLTNYLINEGISKPHYNSLKMKIFFRIKNLLSNKLFSGNSFWVDFWSMTPTKDGIPKKLLSL